MNLHFSVGRFMSYTCQKVCFILLLSTPIFTSISLSAQGTNLLEISGKVVDQEKKPLPSVSVQIKGTIAGTVTSNDGAFKLRTRNKFPLTLIFSSVGFQ